MLTNESWTGPFGAFKELPPGVRLRVRICHPPISARSRGSHFFIDLLFYHLKLRCFVVIDLKAKGFQPEFAGKMNFYLAAVDDLLRHPDDQPSIGLISCKTKDQIVAEYALRNSTTPIGISEYKLAESLPANLEGSVPTIEELEDELRREKEE